MDNAAFRNLLSGSPQNGSNGGASGASTFKKPAALGSRTRSSVPMTPRNVPGYSTGHEFVRQVAEHTSTSDEPPLKRFKSSAAPKGSKLGVGYTDRTLLRNAGEKEDDKAERLKNLEEQLKLQQIDLAQFERLREQIGVGGDVHSTHLVKGLDWKLLERIRRGEDVNQSAQQEANGTQNGGHDEDEVDEELERALEKEVVARWRSEEVDGEQITQQQPQALTRDEVLRQFREKRDGPAAPVAPVLNDRFKKVASSAKPGKKKFTESVNGRRREVLVITNKDGTTKRKTRWIEPDNGAKPERQPLDMDVPAELAAKHKAMALAEAAENENDDIFADAGNDYDPLAGIDSEDGDTDEDDTNLGTVNVSGPNKRRNYFSTGKDDGNEFKIDKVVPTDPNILAALKRAAEIRKRGEATEGQSGGYDPGQDETAGTKSSALTAKLNERERQDAGDLDYGFGESRFGDDDEEDASLLYDGEEGIKKTSGRKRGPKKRKGDKDNVRDVMSLLEERNRKG